MARKKMALNEVSENDIQNEIREKTKDIATIFRVNVGGFKAKSGRYITSGVPKGFSDLFGFRHSDGKMVFIEVKKPKGKPSEEQIEFLSDMIAKGANAGIARSVEEARRIIND